MITKEKGYSLNVLVITIAVMLILTSTAIVTFRSITKDKEITEFMSDIEEVEKFAMQYYSSKNILPIIYENGAINPMAIPVDMQPQLNENDKGEYYQVDLSKLDGIKLFDNDRGGYILNENTLKVYVLKPTEYEGIRYYTLTDEILGVNKVYSSINDFEVNITGNPITWSSKFEMMVSVPNQVVDNNWTFKYYANGPITAEEFATLGSFFEYGEPIEVTKNGIHSVYVENSEGSVRVVNVIVNKIDEIEPYAFVSEERNIVVGDDELGISKIYYKIRDYEIPDNIRAQDLKTYFQGERSDLLDAGGSLTFKEAYTGERISGVDEPDLGRSILSYKTDYEAYLVRWNEESGDLTVLDDEFPQFQKDGVMYRDSDVNIVLYVEDYAGNSSVTNRDDELCVVSREMLIKSQFIEDIIKPLNGAKVVINDNDKYTNNFEVELLIRSQGAEQMAITTNENEDIGNLTWQNFETVVDDYKLPRVDGEVEVFVYITANQFDKDGNLIYEKVSDTIFLDETPPTDTAPKVKDIENDLMLYVTSMQRDTGSGIESVEYFYRKKGGSYTRALSLDGVLLEEGQIYEIKTKTTDRAGNTTESKVTEVQAPIQVTRTVANAPNMISGMKAIIWDGTLERPTEELEVNYYSNTLVEDSSVEVTWYNYDFASGVNDTKKSMWANAKTEDGSYWVWIPRYAYKIVYYEDTARSKVKGYYQNSLANGQAYFKADGVTTVSDPELVKTKNVGIEIIFLNGTSSTQYKEENISNHNITLKQLPVDYIVHPAFTRIDGATVNNAIGRWQTELTGIWVSKFEMSRADATIDDVGTSDLIKSVPSVKSYTNIKIGDAYEASENMMPSMWSHMMKNSEWGAVAYLAHSAYGRNGVEPSANRNSDYITGGGGSSTGPYTCTPTKFETSYAYNVRSTNRTSGMYASTTGNIYGVYDMVGGVAEYVATYLANGNQNITTSTQNSTFTQTQNPSLREVYSVAENDQPINNYRRNGIQDAIYGNAIFETSKGYDSDDGINNDTSKFPYSSFPFMTRGGEAESRETAGLFNFDRSTGAAAENVGFRTVLAF